jgi:hypothetical protein
MRGCLSRQTVPTSAKLYPKLVDHQFFYDEFKNGGLVGNYTCGIARNAVAVALRTKLVHFADTDFLTSLPNYIDNPSVTGFMIEQAVLSSIQTRGLAIGRNVYKSMELVMFDGSFPNFRIDRQNPVLYCPRQYNFQGVDGIIVSIDGNPTAKIFPIQITLALASHSDSHGTFMRKYHRWIRDLNGFNVVLEFVWITPDTRDDEKHLENSKRNWPEHIERFIPLEDVNKDIWMRYQSAREGERDNVGEIEL